MFIDLKALFPAGGLTGTEAMGILEERVGNLREAEARLRDWEQSLIRREQSLAAQRTDLETRRHQLTAMEDNLCRQQWACEDAARRLREEQQQWNKSVGAKAYPQTRMLLSRELTQVAALFREAICAVDEVKPHLRNMVRTVQLGDADTITALCQFHRRLELLPGEEFRREAAYLTGLLRKFFELDLIDPAPGSHFDEELHERAESNGGKHILCCVSRGWVSNDEIITKAVVRTGGEIPGGTGKVDTDEHSD